MPTFTPPTTAGRLVGDPSDPSWRFFRHMGSWATGQTVWKDALGVWHRSIEPYAGGATHTVHDWDQTTITGPDAGLATAQEVYLGGHTYDITEAKAAELVAAGFSIGGHFDSQEQKWATYAATSLPNKEWKGGDGCASVANSSGQTAWTFADTLVGTVDGNGFYISALPQRNSCVIQNSSGQITSQVYANGSSGPAFAHPSPSTNWYWPLDIAVNGPGIDDTRVVMALEMVNDGAFGTIVGNTMLTLNAFVQVVGTTNYGNDDGKFRVYSVYNDTAYHYVTGITQWPPTANQLVNTPGIFDIQSYSRLARCPIGQLTTVANWEFWNGTTWVSTMADAARLIDVHGNQIEGETSITKAGSTFVMCAISIGEPELRCYKSTTAQGPWTFYHVERTHKPPTAGASPPAGRRYGYYQPKWHEHLNPSATTLVATYMRNTFNLSSTPGSSLSDIHVSTFAPQFIYIPAP